MASIGINTDLDFSAPTSSTPVVGASKILKLVTASRAVVSNASGDLAASAVTATELGYVSGVTSAIQTQLNALAATLPVADTQTLIKGSADATKLLRFEVDGFTTGTTRVLTPPNADIVIAGSASALTSGRVPYVTTGGLLTDNSTLAFNSGTSVLTVGTLGTSGSISVNEIRLGGYSYSRIGYNLGDGAPFYGYNLNANSNNFQHDSTGSLGGVGFNSSWVYFFSNASSAAGTAAQVGGFIQSNSRRWGIADVAYTSVFSPGARLEIRSGTAATIGAIIRGAASQSANLTEWQNSAGTVLSGIDASGRFYAPTALTASTVGAAGGASALPATPTGYILVNVNGTQMKVPYFAT